MKARMTKMVKKYNYPKNRDARKECYGYENVTTEESEGVVIEVKSIRDKLNEIIDLIDANKYDLTYFDLKMTKVVNKSLRKEVRFEFKEDRDY